jgi:Icc-related predicted phosphoesterase
VTGAKGFDPGGQSREFQPPVKILAVSDVETGFLHSPVVASRFPDANLIISCGDLHPSYLDYIHSMLNMPLYYVRGNHDNFPERGEAFAGFTNLHGRLYRLDGLLLAGLEGSLIYNREGPQFSQSQMWAGVFSLVPAMLRARLASGRFLDVFVSHAPPWGIHDTPDDPPHRGFKAFRWLIRVFHPAVHIHGHIHVFHPHQARETVVNGTRVINAYGYREIII